MSVIANFFARPEEVIELWGWIGSLPGIRLMEADCRPGSNGRQFDRFPISEWENGARDFSVAAWPSSAGGEPKKRFAAFEPATAARLGVAGRTIVESPAFIKLNSVVAPDQSQVGPSELIFWTERTARKSLQFDESQIEAVDWAILQEVVLSIRHHLRMTAAATWRSIPVSAGVATRIRESNVKLWFWGAVGAV